MAFDGDAIGRRDPRLIAGLLPVLRPLLRHYFRLRVQGLENLPRTPALLAANHNGGIFGPDLPCTLGTLWDTLGPEAPLYALAHDFAMRQLVPAGIVLQRFGAIRATPDNAARVLSSGGQALVYPGGDLDAYRHFDRRHEIVLGQRTGFVRVAQRCGVPIVPVVAHGAHRSAYIFTEGEKIAEMLRLRRWGRLDRFPIALSLPWGLAVGPWVPHLPLPFPIKLRFLPGILVAKTDDPATVREVVRQRMQTALDEMVEEDRRPRRSSAKDESRA